MHLLAPCVETLDGYLLSLFQSLFHQFFSFKIKAKMAELEMGKHFPET